MTLTDNQARRQRHCRVLEQDLSRGASALADQALVEVARFARECPVPDTAALVAELTLLADELAGTRPGMVVIANGLAAWRQTLPALSSLPLEQARQRAGEQAEAVRQQRVAARRAVVANTLASLQPGTTLMTHSHSGAVEALFAACAETGLAVSAILTESRPGYEGHALAARLSALSIPVQLITDAQMALFVGQADRVVLGADTVLADGSVINKAGSALLALAAREAGVPVWVLADHFKTATQEAVDGCHEEKAADELGAPSLPGVRVRNCYFEVVPAALIHTRVDEHGAHWRFARKAKG